MRPVTLAGLLLLSLVVLWAIAAIPCTVCGIALITSQPLGDPIEGDDPVPDSPDNPGNSDLLGDPIEGDDPVPD